MVSLTLLYDVVCPVCLQRPAPCEGGCQKGQTGDCVELFLPYQGTVISLLRSLAQGFSFS